MNARAINIAIALGLVLTYAGTSVGLGGYWRADGPSYRKVREKEGDVERERLMKDGETRVAQQKQDAGLEEARITNHAKVRAAGILEEAREEAARKTYVGDAAARTYFLTPYFWYGERVTALEAENEAATDPAEISRKKLLIAAFTEARDSTRSYLTSVSNRMMTKVTDANRR